MGVRVLVYCGGCDSGGWGSKNIGGFRNGGGGGRNREFTCDLHGGVGSPGWDGGDDLGLNKWSNLFVVNVFLRDWYSEK